MKHIMIDLETLGTVVGCAIVSVGAVEFDPSKKVLGETFYKIVDLNSCLDFGLTIDHKTLAWWLTQPHDVRLALYSACSGDCVKIGDVLKDLAHWFAVNNFWDAHVYSNGASFDIAMLEYCYSKLGHAHWADGSTTPWHYKNIRCYRTLRADGGVRGLPPRTGTHHNALDDAKYQAICAVELLKNVGDRNKH